MRYSLLLFFFITIPQHFFAQKNDLNNYDSINILRNLANDRDLDINIRFEYARQAIKLSKLTKNDSTILASNRVLSYLFLVNRDVDSLYTINFINLNIAGKLKDTLKMAYASHNLGYHFDELKKVDSAYSYYFKAREFYRVTQKKRLEADVLSNMARIQRRARDFIGSEINAIEGIKILNELPKDDNIYDALWSLNNLIGIISGQINRYDKAIEYHNNALGYANKIKDDYLLNLYSKTNIAILYRRKGDYREANKLFLKLLEDKSIKAQDPSTYASILSSLAYCKLLAGDKNYFELERLFRESLSVAKEEKGLREIMITSEQFSELFLKKNENDSADFYANKSYELGKQFNANETILNTLILKSKIEKGEKSREYLLEHIKLSDSLILEERRMRNQFTRINFETDTYKQKEEAASRLNTWLIIISLSLLSSLMLVYVIKTKREKKKELQLAKQQQDANEEIYNLMLSQQDKMDEARAVEKKRISQEIHDGILGRLFGARLSLDSLNMVKTDEAVINRGNYINELKEIEQDIRQVSHDLNTDFIANASFLSLITTLIETQCVAYNLGQDITVQEPVNWDLLNNKTKIHLYRIIQESLQNIYKHAYANLVSINIKQVNNLISLTIKDDGEGFDAAKSKDGIGLKNMKSRVNEINGHFSVKTSKSNGTSLTIDVPV
ncbi:tetratricopeptide repeat-containing sensor histidine kinase [uncultured Lacinutrix sp.]|uniref:tetratricopeptide repeat-containing sensor histidine kinase n=1 Tax=uncultured Lacinutrix sp. TaxID=574032 RepID=UPI00260D9A88|nr:tetratricopeptide repeat-containing sensor histidine kinase [uncultured Lacinutrix sp.]